MIPALPEYADWFVLLCVAVAGAVGYGWWRRTQRQESDDAESWDKFNDFMAFMEKGKRKAARGGFTLVEMLVATTLAILLIGAVAVMFGKVAEGITDSRSMLESAERLRLAETRLQMDLAGITATVNPPLKPEKNEGYFEYIEGPVGVVAGAYPVAVNIDNGGQPDLTVGDIDDILMFTMRTTGKPFVGRSASTGTIESNYAEVAWFVRGRTLYRRVLLVAPSAPLLVPVGESFYGTNDISVRLRGGILIANNLGNLTMRENRFAHPMDIFPFDVRRWGQLRLPTLRECSQPSWIVGQLPPAAPPNPATTDLWTNDSTQRVAGDYLGSGTRVSDDVILTNVIGFDVKVFDPGRGEYVNLGNAGAGRFAASSAFAVGRDEGIVMPNVYDTWSTHYEVVGAPGLIILHGSVGRSVDGFDLDKTPTIDENLDGDPTNDGNGVVDDDEELLTSPPYRSPVRGIQVKIRVFEPDSRQVREVTVIQDFLP